MSVITKVEEKKKANGKKTWIFTMDDGTEGFCHKDNPEAPWEYKEGDMVNFTVEKQKDYNLLLFTRVGETATQPKAEEPKVSESGRASLTNGELISLKMQLRKEVVQVIGQVASAGRIEPKDMPEFYNMFYLATDASIDELCK